MVERGGRGVLTEVNIVDAEDLQTLCTGFLAILSRAVCAEYHRLVSLHVSKLCRKEDLIALSCAFEPFANELVRVTIKAMICLVEEHTLQGH